MGQLFAQNCQIVIRLRTLGSGDAIRHGAFGMATCPRPCFAESVAETRRREGGTLPYAVLWEQWEFDSAHCLCELSCGWKAPFTVDDGAQ